MLKTISNQHVSPLHVLGDQRLLNDANDVVQENVQGTLILSHGEVRHFFKQIKQFPQFVNLIRNIRLSSPDQFEPGAKWGLDKEFDLVYHLKLGPHCVPGRYLKKEQAKAMTEKAHVQEPRNWISQFTNLEKITMDMHIEKILPYLKEKDVSKEPHEMAWSIAKRAVAAQQRLLQQKKNGERFYSRFLISVAESYGHGLRFLTGALPAGREAPKLAFELYLVSMCSTGQQYCDGVVASVHMTQNAEFALLEARPCIFYRDVCEDTRFKREREYSTYWRVLEFGQVNQLPNDGPVVDLRSTSDWDPRRSYRARPWVTSANNDDLEKRFDEWHAEQSWFPGFYNLEFEDGESPPEPRAIENFIAAEARWDTWVASLPDLDDGAGADVDDGASESSEDLSSLSDY